jgi:hypothetical protein
VGFQSALVEMDVGLDRFQAFLRPVLYPVGAVPQQKFGEPVPGFQLVLLGRFPSSRQITQSLMRGVRYPDAVSSPAR